MTTISNTKAPESSDRKWPSDLSQVPYWVFQDEENYKNEQKNIFHGPFWSYLCLEAELAEPGDFCATFIGEQPVLVTRDHDGQIYAFENRCAHRGALIAMEHYGHAKDFTCVYHAWSYNLQGDLTGVAFEEGINGKGGMGSDFCKAAHSPRRLRLANVHGLIFGSLDNDVPEIEEYLGQEVLDRIERVLGGRKVKVLGRFTQKLPNNWKLYMENVKDSYHASILHLFFTTFGLNKLNQKGGIIVSESGAHHVSWSAINREAESGEGYKEQKIRSESEYALEDPSLVNSFPEHGDDITLQILSVSPGFVLQQIQNSIAVRQVLPTGVDKTDLNWTYLGYEDDTEEQQLVRMKQSNLVGPAGYVSMEDGAIGGFVQRGIAGASGEFATVQMGGKDAVSSESRVTEASIRGFWKVYREAMGYQLQEGK
ncbi:aromatic ring-hydroxylating dioxygenase subunit alpha [Glutamicibacter mysorens]|uniref:aromatic ring-hydroxylating dioxygenase subunit alpha n=1 Tax=Glutamicibacter mysorens TaxID=257984 RepID=UPI0020C6C4B0|nr:aromatic ring-hydroxylating dioxygenase subunit alpha [Glutamicibacter mysorens]UTM45753.1 aromatic ring-hydroxylating dioxygenase subunit alpha [Glutamicibacter mysorens]